MTTSYAGIDPGASGAIAVVTSDGRAEVHDWPGDERALIELVEGITFAHGRVSCLIERQQAMPGQGVSSMFEIGLNFGMWLAAIASQHWQVQIIRACDWKKGLGYQPPAKAAKSKAPSGETKSQAKERLAQEKKARSKAKSDAYKASKAHSVTLAKRLFPAMSGELAGPRGGARDGRAEALILAFLAAGGKI